MKCAIYGRVSTKDQSHEMQTAEMTRFIVARGFEWYETYTDTASGSKESRAGLQRLMTDARAKKFDAVIVFRFDRFARSLSHLVNALNEFRDLGIAFISLHESIDTSTANGRLIFGIMGAIAEFEKELIIQRTKAGMAHAASYGRFAGRPLKIGDRRKVRDMRACGEPLRRIAAETGFAVGTVRNILRKADAEGGKIQAHGT